MHPAFFYLPGERLALPELAAARLDGTVVEVGEGYIPADLIEGPDVRAASLVSLLPRDTAIAGPSAAWVHGAGDRPPARLHVRRAVDRRVRLQSGSRLVFHDTAVPASDLVSLDGVAVTAPARTMTDLALGLHRDPTLLDWTRGLAAAVPGTVDDAIVRLASSSRVPGARRALSTLERLRDLAGAEDQDDVTR